ncbi:thioredoxin family protein [Shewanella sp. Scap07]|uniref:thioredoxin family protein n=1 Tax=Shewanella sp. Scap07 TaxID=2589987 RepID=UPI0015BDA1E8|nr:thioredoxin family protein [Shewanella sp. Scap07]QLE86243.1 thioredoxin family protein [Shewanella sp. Scap07]
MNIEILGSGCKKCTNLAEEVSQVAQQMDIEFNLDKVTDMAKILEYGVMSTPAIVINGAVITAGSVPSTKEIESLLQAHC